MTTTFDTEDTRAVGAHQATTLPVPGERQAAARVPSRRPRLGLGGRIFLLAAGLLVITLGLTVAIAAWRSARVAETTIREDLSRVPEVWAGYVSARSSSSLEQVRSLAMEAGTMAIFADEVDDSTRISFASEDAPAILSEASTIFLFDRASRVLARSDRPDGDGIGQPFGAVPWVASVLDTWQGTTALMRERESLALVASAPVIAGEGETARLQGVLAATFPFDAEAIGHLETLTRGEVAIVLDMARRDEAPDLRVSVAGGRLDAGAVATAVLGSPGAQDRLLDAAQPIGPITTSVGTLELVSLAVPVATSSGEVFGGLLVSRSRDAEMAWFFAMRRVLFAAGGAMLLLALPVSFLLGRNIARPLRQLADGAEAIRDGSLEVELPTTGSGEVGVLAGAFSAMVEELREKKALEDLIAELQARSPVSGPPPVATAPAGSAPALADGALPAVGDVIGSRYRIRAEIGRGGMGVVLRATDLELEEDVALKVLRPGAFDNQTEGLAKLKSEIRTARRISHGNVVRVHDLVEAGGLRCLSMEYVPGTTLLQVLSQRKALGLAPGLQIAKQLCRGLTAVHAAGIVHRDLKPHNVMVLPNGVVKLMDFGISRGPVGGSDGPGAVVEGTPAYMSPEQCRGEPLDHLSDVYSLGLVLWEMFSGMTAVPGASISEVVRKQLDVMPRALGELRDDIPGELNAIVMGCLAKSKTARPQSASLVYQQLREILVVDW
ncbi:MAG: protein kinase [Thermoanaerobaculales bacterium]|jgi:serine/threonine-protein kinase|nr:protein kinase [Thermoanaerobaculales bacterium]